MIERRYTELRSAGARTLEGVAVVYGDTARLPWGRERILPGAFGDVAELDVILNSAHQRDRPLARTGAGLILDDSVQRLAVRADLPETRDADDVLTLVRKGVLRGLSVEIVVEDDDVVSGVREIRAAKLRGIGVVDRPAYPASEVEARQKPARTQISGSVALGEKLACRCRKGCDTILIEPEAFDAALAEAVAGDREITAFLSGHFDRPLASMSSGTLGVQRRGNVLDVAITELPNTSQAQDFLAGLAAARFAVRPYFPDDMSTFTKAGTTATFTEADLRGIEIAAITGPTKGLEDIVVTERPQRRHRIWPVTLTLLQLARALGEIVTDDAGC